ncbi:MAG: aminopeptidase P family protein [Bacteroidetes bacterium]|nr:MAG: aminopeptidase P family protein [Bacteroidota bacterium]
MFSTQTYVNRRKILKEKLESGLVLFPGNNEVGMNYGANPYHFRQDSNFLYYIGIDHPGMAAVLDLDEGTDTLFGDDLSIDDIVWMGEQPTLSEWAAKTGIEHTQPSARLGEVVKKAVADGRTVHYLPPYRDDVRIKLYQWLGIPFEALKARASEAFIRAVVAQRSHKSEEEIAEMEKAVAITRAMHVAAMKAARPGMTEANLTGIVHGIAVSMGGELSYPAILTKDGQTLHNHFHGNVLEEGQMVLGDFGAETAMHYAGDITRTFPVSPQFSTRQKEIYQIVLDAENDAIAALRPGVPYKDIHLAAARQMTEGLKSLGLMKGDPDEAVAAGAHALFFPHGLGHMIGLDVHDMEDLGEDFVGYSDTITRSDQFGTAYLRLGRQLEPGFVLTVEPGIYFIPQLIDLWASEGKFKDFIDYDRVNTWRDFGGIRIEDNVLITNTGHRVLGPAIPKTIEEVEAIRKG